MKKATALFIACMAFQPALAQQAAVRVLSVDSTRMGGLHDFQFFVHDNTKLKEVFGGHDLELRFEPAWSAKRFPFVDEATIYGLYDRRIVVRDLTVDRTVAEYLLVHNKLPCKTLTDINFAEHAGLFTEDEEAPMAAPDSRDKQPVSGVFTTDRECLGDRQFVEGAFSFAVSYAFEQWGGVIREERPVLLQGEANTLLTNSNAGTRIIDTAAGELRGTNNGPASYEVEFLPGGTEAISLRYGSVSTLKVDTFTVPYLNVRVHNTISYERPAPGGGTTVVRYPDEIPHVTVADFAANSTPWPDAKDVPIDAFNLTAYAWVNGRESDNLVSDRPRQAAGPGEIVSSQNRGMPIGTQGHYYLSITTTEGTTVDFVHIFLASGAEFAMDFANKRGRRASPPAWPKSPIQPTTDFKAGDKVQFSIFGGALGFPLPEARVVFRVDTVATDVAEQPIAPGSVSAAPNPFSDNTIIRYTLDQPAHVTLSVVDELGRTVRILTDEHQQAGSHAEAFPAAELKNGCYFYRLNAGGAVTTGKIVVLQ